MPRRDLEKPVNKTEQAVRKIASALPGVGSGVACKGTSLESTTFTVKKKAFLFMRILGTACELRMKLAGKWEKKLVPLDAPPHHLEKWLQESHASIAGRGGRR
jgi:hypothetical protein